MLKTKFRKGTVLTIMLPSGVEILARFEELNEENEYVLRKPVQLSIYPENQQIRLTPWVVSSDVVALKHLASIGVTEKSIADKYLLYTEI